MLSLPQEVFLLAISDQTGMVHPRAQRALPSLISSAILSELVQRGKLRVTERSRLEPVDLSPLGDPALDGALAIFRQQGLPEWIEAAIARLRSDPRTVARVIESLYAQHILEKQDTGGSRLAPYPFFPLSDKNEQFWVRLRLRAIALAATPADERTTRLFSLLQGSHLLGLIFDRYEMRIAGPRVRNMTRADAIGTALIQANYDNRFMRLFGAGNVLFSQP